MLGVIDSADQKRKTDYGFTVECRQAPVLRGDRRAFRR